MSYLAARRSARRPVCSRTIHPAHISIIGRCAVTDRHYNRTKHLNRCCLVSDHHNERLKIATVSARRIFARTSISHCFHFHNSQLDGRKTDGQWELSVTRTSSLSVELPTPIACESRGCVCCSFRMAGSREFLQRLVIFDVSRSWHPSTVDDCREDRCAGSLQS